MSNFIEIATNPDILIDLEFNSNQILIEGLKLNEDYNNIPLIDIVEIYVEDYDCSNSNFTKRLAKFKTHSGAIHLAGEISFHIENQGIDQIILRGKYIDNLKNYGSEKLLSVFGEPDKILSDYIDWAYDHQEYAKIYAYSSKKIYFFIDIETEKINEIRIGNLDEKKYVF